MSVWIVIVAAGSGTRFGGPKQYELLGSARIVDRSIATACRVGDRVALVVAAADVDELRAQFRTNPTVVVVAGGASRSASVRGGLGAVSDDAEVIVVHDAARPLASDALFEQVIASVRGGADAAVPGVAVSDSLRRVDGGIVDRGRVVAVQTPQAFRADLLRSAHRDGPDASDDATLVEMIGGKVEIVPGESTNFKITTSHDLMVARMLVAAEGPL
ncbi:MAG TPA: IspD/TarI family cytidylyltransferase [Acidimicrobiales bacterium]|nr:IspD/TarI family cytidylyltransferase [Acidimicrobiales bacterium]